jgi:hypothetical protein
MQDKKSEYQKEAWPQEREGQGAQAIPPEEEAVPLK